MPSPITLDEYLDAVTDALGAVSGVSLAMCDGVLEEDEAGPVVLVEVVGRETLEEIGTTEWHARVLLELQVLVARTDRVTRRRAMAVAESVALAARWQTWGLEMMPAEVPSVTRREDEPYGEKWDVVTVEVVQEAVWWAGDAEPDPAVTTVHAGVAPNIGLGHEDDYATIVPDEGSL